MSESKSIHQYRMSMKLKAVAIAIGVLGAVFFIAVLSVRGYLTWEMLGRFDLRDPDAARPTVIYAAVHFIFTIIVMICCYKILWHFWGVCTQIGCDNSFSAENAALFRKMSRTSIVCAACYGLRFAAVLLDMMLGFPIYIAIAGLNRVETELADILTTGYCAVMTIVFILFAVLSSALSELVRRASEVQAENDLTI